jgi:hypothetical protein
MATRRVPWYETRSVCAADASYLVAIHQHMAVLAAAGTRHAEVPRWERLAHRFGAVQMALQDLDEHDRDATVKLNALSLYMYRVGKCEWKNIIGFGYASQDCCENGFFMVDPVARTLIDAAEARQVRKPPVSYWPMEQGE